MRYATELYFLIQLFKALFLYTPLHKGGALASKQIFNSDTNLLLYLRWQI